VTWPRERGQDAPGFTLLELLVAITLLGLLIAALFGGLRLGARVWERGETRLDASNRMQVVQDFVRQRVAEAVPLETVQPDEGGASQPLFRGTKDLVRFAGIMPEHLGAGIYLMEFALAETGDAAETRNFVLRLQPMDLEGESAETEPEPEVRVLIERVDALEFAYFGAIDPGAQPEWWEEWAELPQLPALVRLQVRFADDDPRRWPELIVRPMVESSPFLRF
jgi:general secretion pathway protein J